MNTNIQSYQQYYQENQYLLSPFSPIDNTTSDRYHTDLILQNNKEKYQQLLKENEGVFIRYGPFWHPSTFPLMSDSQWLYNQSFQQSLTSYLTYRSRPVDIVEDPLDIFDYDRLVSEITELLTS